MIKNTLKFTPNSPYVVQTYDKAIYLESLLEKNFDEYVKKIQKKGYEINETLVNNFFSKI